MEAGVCPFWIGYAALKRKQLTIRKVNNARKINTRVEAYGAAIKLRR